MFTSIAISWAVFQCRLNQSIKQWDSMYKQKIWEYLQFMTLARGKKERRKKSQNIGTFIQKQKYWKNQNNTVLEEEKNERDIPIKPFALLFFRILW